MAASDVTETSSYASSTVCKICSKIKGIYVCPRCNILYCSLLCYQSELHLNCSEAFYKECVMEDIKSQGRDPFPEKKMNEILQQLQGNENNSNIDSDDDNDDSVEDLHERLRNVNLDDADSVWEQLTPTEKQEFYDMLQSGDASQLVVSWEPWWLFRKQKTLIQDVETEQVSPHPVYEANCPTVKNDVPLLSQISKTVAAPCVKYNILNVLGAYCYTTRFMNGEHHSMPAEASNILVNLSANLNFNHTYDSAVLALEAVAHEVVHYVWLGGSQESVICMKNDIECILTGPEDSNCSFYLKASLSDIYRLMSKAKHSKSIDPSAVKKTGEFTKRFKEHSLPSFVQKDKLRLVIKKLEYYLSWSRDHADEICCLRL
ncbi:zinc finger HIT domain-containing protein 2 [Zootermopsis nevadensis]|uniref:Zinc finger HIT domain-containing protein 2 n=1 Tax=Zootermopsis nevadensis TaxID=136037 RepID=A0A067R092_ZOONE|nr:zinc finger HIT domain-containing protein 2 [Zootermopsis nevadensis]KDR12142.1 Zinc finger HIT domain-containing protein 2 [Zootermopsis nevadensis]